MDEGTTYRIDTNKLIKILKMTQPVLKEYLYSELISYGYSPIFADGYLLAVGTLPIGLVAHMDTVFAPPKYVIYKNGCMSGENGLGADDRAGVYGILHLLKQGFRPTVIFTEDEEKGCIGAGKFVKSNIRLNLNYLIELDRQGSQDSVFYDCDNYEFEKFVNSFGFQTAFGSFSDISDIAPHYGVSAVNLSVGYYGQHTVREILIISELASTLIKVATMLASPSSKFEYIPYVYKYTYSKSYKKLSETYRDSLKDYNYNYDGTEYQPEWAYSEKKAQTKTLDTAVFGEFVELFKCYIIRATGETIDVESSNEQFYINVYDEIYDSTGTWVDAYACDYEFNYMTFADFI